jgi:hypothetical protein
MYSHRFLLVQTFLLKTIDSKKFKDKEIKNWVMLFSRNLSNEDKTTILNILKKEDKKFYTDFGVWYEYKNPNVVWKNSLKE